MAPINDQTSYSVHKTSSSSFDKKPFSCMCRDSLSDGFEWFLPITRRGHFFQDSFFENTRSHFDAAVRDVLSRWGETSMLTEKWFDNTTDNLSRYRQLRSRNMKDDNQAVTISSDSTDHKIVLDVHEFVEGEIKVKVIGEKEVLVEGSLEEKDAGGNRSAQKFSRRFPLSDDSDMDAISSVMSSDGILTITIPKKRCTTSQEEVTRLRNNHTSSNNVSQSSSTATTLAKESCNASSRTENSHENREKYCENCYKKIHSEQKTSEGLAQQGEVKTPIKVNTSLMQNDTSRDQNQKTVGSKSFSENVKMTNLSKYQNNCSNSQKEESQFSCNSQMNTQKNEDKNTSVFAADGKQATTTKQEKEEDSRAVPISVNFSPVPITRRGLFFTDSIFENARNDFQSAVQEILSKWGQESSSLMDDLSCYRNIRTRDLREENQAAKVSEDEKNHKFVLDVHDFMDGGEVNVKALNDRELVVEGQVEKQQGCSKSVKRFFKRFVVPGDVILGSVTSIMSSDGVLTITAPKKSPTIQIRDVTSPIRSNEMQQTSSHCKQESVCEKQNTAQSTEEASKSTVKISCESDTSNINQSSSSHQNSITEEHIIPVQVEGRISHSEADHNVHTTKMSSGNERREDRTMKLDSDSSITKETSAKTETSNTDNRRTIEITRNNVKCSDGNVQTSTAGQSGHIVDSIGSSSMGRLLPVTRRGSFFNDSFFEDSRQSFQTAVSKILQKFNENSTTNDIAAYRGLRQRNLTEESQAVNIHEDEHCHKVVLDARDFTEGKINVSVVGERELLIEGRTESKNDSSSSSQTFSRRFLLPDSVDINSITSAISSDGILTVESSKKGASGLLSDVQKTSSEAHSRNENHYDSGHKWEEKSVKESSEQSEGYSSRSYSTSYRAHQEQTLTQAF